MARPARGSGPSAVERLTGAFWAMLAETPYADIKVVPLARRAGASPNTLYYHFGCMEDLARHALEAELDAGLVRRILAGSGPDGDGDVGRRFSRVALFARSDSADLTSMLAASLRALWLAEAGVSEGELDDAERRDLAFIFGGVVAMLGDDSLDTDRTRMESFPSRPLGRGAVETMAALAGRGATCEDVTRA